MDRYEFAHYFLIFWAGFMILLLFGILGSAMFDSVNHAGDCKKPGYQYEPRVFFRGDPKCVFSQEKYDADVRSYYLSDD